MRKFFRLFTVASLSGLAAACGDSTGPAGGASNVSLAFRVAGVGVASIVPSSAPDAALSTAGRATLIVGTNGTLQLDEVSFIVAEIELEREDGDDCDDDDSCEEFSVGPQFIQLDLDGVEVPVVTQAISAGLYEELEFEIEDIELDEGEDAIVVQAIFDEIRAAVPDWPEEASMLVTGSFTPTGGAPVLFRVFFEAEVEIEQEFDPPLDLTTGDGTVTVVVDPGLWFARPDGSVMDLSQFNGSVVEFEAEFEDGFAEVEFDDEDDD